MQIATAATGQQAAKKNSQKLELAGSREHLLHIPTSDTESESGVTLQSTPAYALRWSASLTAEQNGQEAAGKESTREQREREMHTLYKITPKSMKIKFKFFYILFMLVSYLGK